MSAPFTIGLMPDCMRHYVADTWTRSYFAYRPRYMAAADYFPAHSRYVDRVLEIARVDVAVPKEVTDICVGYIVHDSGRVYYFYTAAKFRRMGICRALFSAPVGPQTVVTWTPRLAQVPLPGTWSINEFAKWS